MGMFDYFEMLSNYEQRKVDRYEGDNFSIDTCSVSDGAKQYETAIGHPDYNFGSWIVVEAYDTIDEAQIGHDKWVAIMNTEPLPDKLVDCANAEIVQALQEFGGNLEFPRVQV
jgi:hypothetical protein